jgi:SAM-dependent methyltransferase
MKNEFEKNQDEFYENFYSDLMGTGLIAKFWRIIHNQLEAPFKGGYFSQILEVGSGNGEHLQSVRCGFQNYFCTDLRVGQLNKMNFTIPGLVIQAEDVCSLSFQDSFFDRVVMTCVLSHLNEPISALQELRRVTKNGGFVSIYLPCEPGIFLRFARKVSTRAKAKKLGIQRIEFLHYLEHRNYFIALDFFLRDVYKNDSIRKRNYPFRLLSWNANLYTLYTIKISKDA